MRILGATMAVMVLVAPGSARAGVAGERGPASLEQALLVQDPLRPAWPSDGSSGEPGRAVIVRTSQREVHDIGGPGWASHSARRLPEGASPLVADRDCAWSITPGALSAKTFALLRVGVPGGWVDTWHPRFDPDLATASVVRVIAADDENVYLEPGMRFSKHDNRIERGHLDAYPTLSVMASSCNRRECHLLATGPGDGEDGRDALWLVARRADRTWDRARVGDVDPDASIARDGAGVLVAHGGHVERFDAASLALIEDVTPRLAGPADRVIPAPSGGCWVLLRAASGVDRALFRVDQDPLIIARETKLPPGLELVGDDGRFLWAASLDEAGERDVVAIDLATGEAHATRIRSRGGERLADLGHVAGRTAWVLGSVALLPVLLPVAAVQAMTPKRDRAGKPQAVPPAPVVADSHVVPAGTRVRWRLVAPLSTKDRIPGDPADGLVDEDVVVDGHVLVARGASVRATVMSVQALSGNGPPSILLSGGSVEAVDGGPLRLITVVALDHPPRKRPNPFAGVPRHLTLEAGTPYESTLAPGVEVLLPH